MSETTFNFTWGLPELEELGFVRVYGFMLKHYASLGVTRQEMLCIIHLASYRWDTPETDGSRPSQRTLAEEMGYGHANRVGEIVRSLEEKKMLEIRHNPGFPSTYDFSSFARKCLTLYLQGLDTPTEKRGGDQRKNVGGVHGKTLTNKIEEGKKDRLPPAEEAPEPEEGYTITRYYKDQFHVRVLGNRTRGPWVTTCPHCDLDVTITQLGEPVGCGCGMHEFVLMKHRAKSKAKVDDSPAGAYFLITGRSPKSIAQEWVDEMNKVVTDIQFWRRVVKEYCGQGWNRGNVSNMLHYYTERKIPGQRVAEQKGPEIVEEDGEKTLIYEDDRKTPAMKMTEEDGVRTLHYS